MRSMKPFALLALAALVTLVSCEDALTPIAAERVRLATLESYTLLLQAPSDGSIGPSPGSYTVKDGEAFEVTATANAGFSFLFWEQTGGEGTVTFDNANNPSTRLRVSGGNAAVRPRIDDTSYVLSVVANPASEGNAVSVSSVNVEKDLASGTISATPGPEYNFTNWTVSSGSSDGISFSPNANSASVTVTASAGDATLQANFTKKSYTLTVQYQTGGYGSPNGSVSVVSGANRALYAYASSTYIFDGWEKVSGAGTESFGNQSLSSTTVNLVGGSATIRAKFRKEVITLSEAGTLAPPDVSTYPDEIIDLYVSGSSMFVIGNWNGSDGVIRKIDLSNPQAPSSGFNDYKYLTGIARGLTGNGANLIASTATNLYSLAISGFSSGSTLSSFSPAVPARDVEAGDASLFWALHSSTGFINMYYYSTRILYSNIASQSSGWSFQSFALASGNLFAIEQDNGAHRISAYDLYTQQSTYYDPNSYHALHNGFDMDPGSAGSISVHPDGELIAVPVIDEGGVARLRFYDATYPSDIGASYISSATLSGNDLNDTFFSDYYLYTAGANGGSAFISVVDTSNLGSPAVVRTLTISDFATALKVRERNGYLYVWVDDAKSGVNQKAVLKIYQINAD
jgi:hypothetical protein